MTDERDGEFEVHPGDPWHPGWTDDAADTREIAAIPGETDEGSKKRRRFGRKRRDRDEATVSAAESWPDDQPAEVVVVDDDTRFRPPEGRLPLPGLPPAASLPAAEAPMPAWLSDPPRPEREAVLPVEMPSWVGTSSIGAEGVAAGFDEPLVDLPGERSSAAIPVDDDLAVAFSALGAIDDEVEVAVSGIDDDDDPATASVEAFEALRHLEAASPETTEQDAFEALRRLEEGAVPPVTGVYGVASKEAFEALRERDPADGDLSEWAAFAEAGSAATSVDPVPRRARPAPEQPPVIADSDEIEAWAAGAEEPREKRGRWPFRRRHRDEEATAEVPTEWEDDGTQVPRTWFPDVDEDVVVPPSADLPEVEWPAAAPQPVFDPVLPDPDRTVELPTPGIELPDELQARRQAAPRWVEPPPIPVESSLPASLDEPADDLQADGPWRLEFDDGTVEAPYGSTEYDPVPPAAIRGDRDVWTAEPGDPDATVEMTDPGLRFSEDIYGGSVTIEHRGLAEEIFRMGEEDTEWQAMSAAMPGVETGVVGFEDVADLSTGDEYQERVRSRSDFGMRVGTGLLLTVFLLGTMFVGGGAMAVFIGAMALLGIWEFYGTLRRLEFRPLGAIGYLGGAGLLAASWFHGPIAMPIALVAIVVVTFFVYAFSPMREDALANGGLTVLGVAWVAGTVVFAFPMLHQEDFRVLVMAIVASTVAMDVGAYAVGRTWGRRALAPVVSPNKSVEGLVGGVILAMGAAAAFGALAEPFELASGLALGAIVSVMAPLGDLAESMVKRSLGVKDMGTILPGHGGVLDRIDGFLFVIPAAWVLYQVVGFLG